MKLTLFFNARFYTLDQQASCNWLLCAAGKIIARGENGALPEISGVPCNRIDLGGRAVIPAFCDAHTHYAMTAMYEQQLKLTTADSLAGALKIIEQKQNAFEADQWVLGGGYNKNIWKDGQPHKKYLDHLFPNNPVALDSKDCHGMWANSAALHLAGISSKTKNPAGGAIDRDDDGQINGLVYDNAVTLLKRAISKPGKDQICQAVKKIGPEFHKLGITSVHTMEGFDEFAAFQELNRQKQLDMRVHIYLPQQDMEKIIRAGISSGYGNEWLSFGGVKFFTDGSLGSQTADMLKPYAHRNDYSGLELMTADQLNERIALANMSKLSCAVHAIGDRAVVKTLDAFEKSRNIQTEHSLNNRMEHAQLVPDSQIRRFRELNVAASMQPIHIADDVLIAEKYWAERTRQAYPMKSLHKAGVTLAFGSDAPVADPDPIKGIYSAVFRRYQLDPAQPVWHKEQALSVDQAVRAYTTGPAKISGVFSDHGTLSVGKTADMIVLNKDIFMIEPEQLLDVKVLKTIQNAKIVYEVDR